MLHTHYTRGIAAAEVSPKDTLRYGEILEMEKLGHNCRGYSVEFDDEDHQELSNF